MITHALLVYVNKCGHHKIMHIVHDVNQFLSLSPLPSHLLG